MSQGGADDRSRRVGDDGVTQNGDSDGSSRQDPLGSAAEEAKKLFDAFQQRVGRELGKGLVKGGIGGIGDAFGAGGRSGRKSRSDDVWAEAVAGQGHDEYICRACPVCRVIAARKESGGEVADHLIAAGGELVTAFRQMVDALQRPAAPRTDAPPRPRDAGVEHIDLG
jgi:hypothetical protein